MSDALKGGEDFRPLLEFWFGVPGSAGYGEPRKAWFSKKPAFDAAVRERFLGLHAHARAGALQAWEEEPPSLLALIILLDQLPRNMFRGTPAAFEDGPRALAAARLMVARGWDAQWPPALRGFVYLPYEHAEDLAAQEESVRLFASLPAGAERDDMLEWARKHQEVIRRFGRFPHRNAILGRVSTPDEEAFLGQPGSRF
jgi:uncharacterized protein (DUF924 family)